MFQNITHTYDSTDASIEIFVILIGAFAIGFLLAWIIKPSKNQVQKSKASKNASKAVPIIPTKDDLQLIEGIGPKIETHLRSHGVSTYKDVVKKGVLGLEDILEQGGKRLSMHSPATWPDQAKLASESKWSELEEYQSILNTGRKK